MTAKWIDSGTNYGAIADITAVYNSAAFSAGGVTANGGRWGEGAMHILNGGSNTISSGQRIQENFSWSTNAWVAGFVMKSSSVSTAIPFLRIAEGSTTHVDLSFDASGHIVAELNGTPIAGGTSTTIFTINTNHVVQLKLTIANSGSVELWIDNTQEFALTGVDTQNAGTGNANVFFLTNPSSSSGSSCDYSEIYIFDQSGSVNNTIAGQYRIGARYATAAANYAQWTPLSSTNISNVDEQNGTDSDTTYNSSFTAGQIDTYQLTPVVPTVGTVTAIQHRIIARKDDAGVRTIAPMQRQSTVDYVGTSQSPALTYAAYVEIVETNPATGNPYTLAEVRASTPEFGYKLIA